MNLDYIIVGCGLAGVAFCEQLRKNNKAFIVFDDASQQSSMVAGGLYNPVVLKRFTAAWKSKEFLEHALPFYKGLEEYLGTELIHETPIKRIFNSIEEQNNWFAASDSPILDTFLDARIQENNNPNINAGHGYGEVLGTGRIDISVLLKMYSERLESEGKLRRCQFQYNDIVLKDSDVIYDDIQARHIIFADGFGLKKNAYFNYLPLRGSKGEYIVIGSPELKLDFILKGSVFLIPLNEEHYLVGATYDNDDKTNDITDNARQELISKLDKMIQCDFEILDQVAGIRPTVRDRRPLIGSHPTHRNLHILNGLGTRGVLASPSMAQQLYELIEKNVQLDAEIDIKRFSRSFVN